MQRTFPRAILVTGASSGIGEALALVYARPGTTLFLSGRDAERLTATADACRARGAVAEGRVLDVRDRDAMAAWIADCDARAPLDLVIANAGISGATAGEPDANADLTREILAVNLDGVVNTVLPAAAAMSARGGGQIALMASLAGYAGMPGAAAYCASKAAVKVWGEGLRGELAARGVGVSVICPGWVDSRITRSNRFPMPFFLTAERAADLIARGLRRDRARIAFPWPTALAAWMLMSLPASLSSRLTRGLPKKG